MCVKRSTHPRTRCNASNKDVLMQAAAILLELTWKQPWNYFDNCNFDSAFHRVKQKRFSSGIRKEIQQLRGAADRVAATSPQLPLFCHHIFNLYWPHLLPSVTTTASSGLRLFFPSFAPVLLPRHGGERLPVPRDLSVATSVPCCYPRLVSAWLKLHPCRHCGLRWPPLCS